MDTIKQKQIIVKVIPEAYPSKEDMERLICYVWRMSAVAPWGAFGVYPPTVRDVSRAFLYVQRCYGKLNGRKVLHVIVSFPHGSNLLAVRETTKRIEAVIGSGYQNIWGIHTDTGNLHVHIVVNATSYMNGRKITEEELLGYLDAIIK